VEALLEGEADAVDDMLNAMHQGPALAQVDRILVEEGNNDDDGPRSTHFEVT
jgi:acylphosphatase